ncbi:MAG: hypothetical protein EBS19_05335 [Spirochaetia bacterium]|nr:hypothetical protein [Spirochaetia bacterium]
MNVFFTQLNINRHLVIYSMSNDSSYIPITYPKSITDLYSKILRPAQTSIYHVQFNLPKEVDAFLKSDKSRFGNGKDLSNAINDIGFTCINASLPGSSLLTNEATNDFSGVTERFAYRRSYDDRADFTFIVDIDYSVIEIFEGWMRYISGEGDTNSSNELKGNVTYRFKFPDEYRSNIFITKFERTQFEKDPKKTDSYKRLIYEFINSFPISINSMPVSYGSNDYLAVTVSFSYVRYIQTRINV